MNLGYRYELWDGHNVIGHIFSQFKLMGREIVIPEVSIFKQKYDTKHKNIKCPIVIRIVYDNGMDTLLRKVIYVRRKSKRQIEILKAYK